MAISPLKETKFITLTMLLAAGLRLFDLVKGLSQRPLWFDEAFTAWLAQLSLTQLIAATAGDVHPPLYYLAAWSSVQIFGPSPLGLRLPSAIFGLLAVWLAYRLFHHIRLSASVGYVQDVRTNQEGLKEMGDVLNPPQTSDMPMPVIKIATLTMAVMPVQLYYSQEARMYTLLLVLSIWAAIELKQNHFGRFTIVALMALYTHNAALFTLFALGVWWLAMARKTWMSYLKQWGLTAAIIAIGYAPWLKVSLSQTDSGFWMRIITPGMVINSINYLFWYENGGQFYAIHAGLLAIGLLLAGWIGLARNSRGELLIPPLTNIGVSVIFSLLVTPILLPRAFIGVTPWLYIATAWAMWQIWRYLPRPVTYFGIMPVVLLSIFGYLLTPHPLDDTEKLIKAVHPQPEDICYHLNITSLIIFRYQLPNCDHWVLPPVQTHPALTQEERETMGMQQAALSKIPQDWRRAWVFINDDDDFADPYTSVVEQIASQYPDAKQIMRVGKTINLKQTDLWLITRER